jgi:hypothetical protein
MSTIKHLDIYSAYSLLNSNLVITYKIDGIPMNRTEYCIEKVNNNEYLFPLNLNFKKFFNYTETKILNISTFNCPSTVKYILDTKNMISKYDGNMIVKNFFYINSAFIFEILDLLKYNYSSSFPNDGFIIYNLDTKKIYKLKPLDKMSIDVRKGGNFFYSNNKKLDDLSISYNNENNGIYRLYPLDNSGNNWKIGEKREDKDLSNPLWLIYKIIQLIRQDINYRDLKLINQDNYYENYIINSELKVYLDRRKEKLLHRLNNLVNNKSIILDFGCGFGNYMNNLNYNYYLGVDKDLSVLESIISKKRSNELWLDFSEGLNYSDQVKKLGPFWEKTQRGNYNKLKKNYSLIIFNHSIHNVKNLKNMLNFIKSNYKNVFLYIGTFNIKTSFSNKFQSMEILEETDKTFKVKFNNSWINKVLIEVYYKIDYLKTMFNKYQINYSIQPYNPSILE